MHFSTFKYLAAPGTDVAFLSVYQLCHNKRMIHKYQSGAFPASFLTHCSLLIYCRTIELDHFSHRGFVGFYKLPGWLLSVTLPLRISLHVFTISFTSRLSTQECISEISYSDAHSTHRQTWIYTCEKITISIALLQQELQRAAQLNN